LYLNIPKSKKISCNGLTNLSTSEESRLSLATIRGVLRLKILLGEAGDTGKITKLLIVNCCFPGVSFKNPNKITGGESMKRGIALTIVLVAMAWLATASLAQEPKVDCEKHWLTPAELANCQGLPAIETQALVGQAEERGLVWDRQERMWNRQEGGGQSPVKAEVLTRAEVMARRQVVIPDGVLREVPQTLGTEYSDSSTASLIQADVDGDGDQDVLQGTFSSEGKHGRLRLFENVGLGNGYLVQRQDVASPWGSVTGLTVGDLNGDGAPELLTLEEEFIGGWDYLFYSHLRQWTWNGTNFVSPVEIMPRLEYGTSASLADIERDGDLDLLLTYSDSAWGYGSHPSQVYLNDGHGNFSFSQNLARGDDTWSVGAAFTDLNGDGYPDVALCLNGGGYGGVPIFRNRGDGTFEAADDTALPSWCEGLIAAKLDPDDDVDFIVHWHYMTGANIWTNNGAGVFSNTFALGSSVKAGDITYLWRTAAVVVGPVTRGANGPDIVAVMGPGPCKLGVPELATACGHRIFTRQTDDTYVLVQRLLRPLDLEPTRALLADFTGDGWPDLLVGHEQYATGDGWFLSPKTRLWTNGGPGRTWEVRSVLDLPLVSTSEQPANYWATILKTPCAKGSPSYRVCFRIQMQPNTATLPAVFTVEIQAFDEYGEYLTGFRQWTMQDGRILGLWVETPDGTAFRELLLHVSISNPDHPEPALFSKCLVGSCEGLTGEIPAPPAAERTGAKMLAIETEQ
jgi:hypothetical protein